MKKLLACGSVICSLTYLLVSTAILFSPDRSRCMPDADCLLQTHWKQTGGFQRCTPDNLRIGCWGTALAQLAYYHRLKPYGLIEYTSTRGFRIREDLSDFAFDFPQFSPVIDSSTAEATIRQLATYNYYAALVVKKDFGTGKNMDLLPAASFIEKHYKARVHRYISWQGLLPYTNGKLEEIIYRELNNKRPVFLHFSNFADIGHSVIVDGYCYSNGFFRVHLNQGQGGPTDGWYDFYRGFLKPDDNKLRVLYTFRPL